MKHLSQEQAVAFNSNLIEADVDLLFFVAIDVTALSLKGCNYYYYTVDHDYNNIGCNKTSAVAKRFPGMVFFFPKPLY